MARLNWFSLLAVGTLVVPTASRIRAPEVGGATETIYYVSAAGSDATGAPGDPSRPYRSPFGAFRVVPADITSGSGDHVIQLTDNSTYGPLHLSGRATDAHHRIVVRAAAGSRPTMDADFTADRSGVATDNNPALLIQADHVIIQGLHFTNTNIDWSLGNPGEGSEVMARLEGSHSIIEGNYFDGNARTPTRTDMFLLICNTAHDNLIAGNRFDYSGGKALIHITASCGGGSPGRQIIRNNVLSRFGNKPQVICGAINFGGQPGTLAGDSSIVENNTIYDNGGGCYGLGNTNGSRLTVRNNIFSRITGHRYAIGCNQATGWSSGVAYHSLMFGNTQDVESACWSLSGTITGDPHFVNPDATPPDLHVQSTAGSRRSGSSAWTVDPNCSPAIDNGSPDHSFELEPSPNGGRRNLGAYGNTPEASKSCTGSRQARGSPPGRRHPLDDIKNTQRIWRGFKGGRQFDPKVLRPGGK